jgi:p-aminobenzoyl-glutamate transporter AbgT
MAPIVLLQCQLIRHNVDILHGLTFSLFLPSWLEATGSKNVFLALGVIQLLCLLFTIPMFIYGKRARAWVASKDMMRNFH